MADEQINNQSNIDPTKNVLDLVNSSIKRIDDLRIAESKRVDEKIVNEREHVREIMAIRADHANDLREAEAKRIDAIRVVDVNAVGATNERATAQAAVLASQVATTAETLRNLVATTASATAIQLDQLTKLLTDRIAALEKAQYEGVGKERVTDPIFSKLIEKIDSLGETRSENTGRGAGLNAGWGYILGAIGLIATILAIGSNFV